MQCSAKTEEICTYKVTITSLLRKLKEISLKLLHLKHSDDGFLNNLFVQVYINVNNVPQD